MPNATFRRTVTVIRHERVPVTTPGSSGWTSRPLPDTQEVVEIEIDVDAIAKILGQKACTSKSGKSQEINGLVVVRKVKAGAA